MKYYLKAATVDAFQFTGSVKSAEDAKEWLSSLDVEDAELTWQNFLPVFEPGQAHTVALDLTTNAGLRTLEADDWLVCRTGQVYVEGPETFSANYETD